MSVVNEPSPELGLNTEAITQLETISFFKGVWPCVYSWVLVFAAVFVGTVAPVLYPICVFLICNRIIAFGLLTHEGIHSGFSRRRELNDFLTRYFCAFPVFISLSRWRSNHFIHHKFIGTALDLDRYLYTYFPMSVPRFFWRLFSGQFIFGHFYYFTELDQLFGLETAFTKIRPADSSSVGVTHRQSDLVQFLCFQLVVFSVLFYFGFLKCYFLFWLIPHFLSVPYVIVYNHLQHAHVSQRAEVDLRSRSILGSKWLMWIFLPLNVNYHLEHHLYPRVPQYNLPRVSLLLQRDVRFRSCYDRLAPTFALIFSRQNK